MVIYMNIKDWHVNMREGFSDRNNLISLKKTLQYDDLDYRTRVEILNKTDEIFVEYFKQENVNWGIIRNRKTHPDFGCDLLKDVFCIPYVEAEEISQDGSWEEVVNNVILNHPYFEVFDLLEYISHETQDITQGELPYDNLPSPEERYNEVFKKEYVGYRFIKGKIRNITDENEIQEIVKASLSPYEEVNFHLDKASERLSDRKNPDYENSIKESISAVEAMCVILLEEKGELGTLLKKLEKAGIKIHPALKEAFFKLYGYTSDAKGIRHAGSIGGTESTFEEAKFMLVSCSAFINYLKEVSIKIK